MSAYDGQPQPTTRQSAGGALADGLIKARSTEDTPRSGGPRRVPETLERSGKVYGATPCVPEVIAEAPHMGAGSQVRRCENLRNARPHGSAAGGSEGCSVNRRCIPRSGARRWSQ